MFAVTMADIYAALVLTEPGFTERRLLSFSFASSERHQSHAGLAISVPVHVRQVCRVMSGHELVSHRLPWIPDSDQIFEWCALIPGVMLKALSREGPAPEGDLSSIAWWCFD